jgi:isoquinoline 1-oxidoreductase beta subunit
MGLALTINGVSHEVDIPHETPLLWALRDALGLKGTKYGCGVGKCGICTVLVDGEAARACVVAASAVAGKSIVTVEGLAQTRFAVLQEAWIAEQVPQCGYCQPGQLLAAAALLARNPRPSADAVDEAMSGVLCRCGTYARIRRGIERAVQMRPAAAPTARAGPPDATPAAGEPAEAGSPTGVLLDEQGRFAPNPWVRIAPDGIVAVVIDRSEMGQGVTTSLAMLVAEELEVDLQTVRTEFAPADPVYTNAEIGEQMTGGSTSVRAAWKPLREAGAAAREMLIAAAAESWKVKRSECRAERGSIVHTPSGKRAAYGSLVIAAARQSVPKRVTLKPPEAFRLIGKPARRLDVPDMVTGRTAFGSDVAVPGMLVASIARCPVFDGKPRRVDSEQALALPGVRAVVKLESGVAVVAESFPAAVAGRQALRISWDEGANSELSNEAIRMRFSQALRRAGSVARDDGDALAALSNASRVVEAVYETPYLAHAALEPMNALAWVRRGRCDVWAPTQAQAGARDTATYIAGVPLEATAIHTTFLGGGFGRKLEQDCVGDAVAIARRVKAPVHLLYTRADDLQHDFYRPASMALLRAALRNGKPAAWFQRIAGPELALDGNDMPYAIPNVREEHVRSDPGVPTGPWRSVGASQNAFMVEGFIDELAHAAGADPLRFRLGLLARSPRHRGVLELAAAKSGWGTPLAASEGRGIAVYYSFGSWVAHVAEVAISPEGAIDVRRVVCAVDCGTVVNPDTVTAQMEGAIALGLSAALKERVRIEGGRVTQANFEDYPILTFAEMPQVEVHIVASRAAPGGVGEPAVPPVAPAVANAVFAATGKRLRSLPLSLRGTA